MLTLGFMTKYFRKKFMNTKNKRLEPKNLIRLFLGIIPILIITIVFSCEEDPSQLGSNLLPDSDKITYRYDTSRTFIGNVLENKPISTYNLSHYVFGEINDPHFGSFKGEFAGQFLPLKYYSTDSTVATFNVDSIYLFLVIDSIYGFPQEGNISFDIYELNKEIEDSLGHAYYSDEDISTFYLPTDLISTNCKISGDTLIKLALTSEFASKLVTFEDTDTTYKNISNFRSAFHGIAIVPNLINSPGGTCNINISSNDSKILMYYEDGSNDSLQFTYRFNNGFRFGGYKNDYTSSIANTYLNNPKNNNDDLLFIQGINGISSKLTFSNINQWIEEDSSYSVLNAELIVPVFKDDNFELFFPPKQLFLYYYNDSISNYVEDYLISENFFDGNYNKVLNQYQFNISKHLMRILNGNIEDSCLHFGTGARLSNSYYVTKSN